MGLLNDPNVLVAERVPCRRVVFPCPHCVRRVVILGFVLEEGDSDLQVVVRGSVVTSLGWRLERRCLHPAGHSIQKIASVASVCDCDYEYDYDYEYEYD